MSVSLDPDIEVRLQAIGGADLVVGIPSFNNAATIGHVVRAVVAGLNKYFADQRTVIVNSDGGSKDGTPQTVASAEFATPDAILVTHPLTAVQKFTTPYHGIPGKGSAFRTIFAIAERLGAKACAVVDSDLRSITPEWIQLLLGPVLQEGFDFVAPLYLRHKYDGTITNSIVYPLTRALYGKEVRQPIGGEFGLSSRARIALFVEARLGDRRRPIRRRHLDDHHGTRRGVSRLSGVPGAKIHDAKDPGADLTSMFVQVVSSVFDLMEAYAEKWAAVTTVEEVPLFGFRHGVGLEPVQVNVDRMASIFRQGVRDLHEVWQHALEPDNLAEIALLAQTEAPLRVPNPLWVRVVYDFAVAYHRRALPREQLLRSLVPLYLGRTASFVHETASTGAAEVEESIRGLTDEFVRQKDYLRQRWG